MSGPRCAAGSPTSRHEASDWPWLTPAETLVFLGKAHGGVGRVAQQPCDSEVHIGQSRLTGFDTLPR